MRCNTRSAIESVFISAVKEADALKHRSQVISGMQKKDHNQLWLGVQNDKFDQFWNINRKLMEHCNDNSECFRYIPFRLYQSDGNMIQRLVKPTLESGAKASLKDLITQTTGIKDGFENCKIIIHGIELPLETPLQWLSEHLSYPDNFLHICLFKRS